MTHLWVVPVAVKKSELRVLSELGQPAVLAGFHFSGRF
jgi:hypothetical protein